MKFCKPIPPIEEVHQVNLLGCINKTSYEETSMGSPKICVSAGVPIREKKRQR